MKTYRIIQAVIAGAIFCFLAFACNGDGKYGDEKNNTGSSAKAMAPEDEVVLNLCPNVVEPAEADTGVRNSYEWVLKGNTKLANLEVKILRQHLAALREQADEAHGSCAYVTGLQLHLALNNNTLQVLYVPMYLCKRAQSDTFDVHIAGTDTLVYGLSSGFTSATSAQKGRIGYYQQNIMFQEANSERAFNSAYDTRAVMVTFQAIMAVLDQNESDTLKIWNYAFKMSGAPANQQVRQSLLLGPHQLTPEYLAKLVKENRSGDIVLYSAFTNNYADRAHICPPSCNDVALATSITGEPDCQEK
jgi:hypothetical protein